MAISTAVGFMSGSPEATLLQHLQGCKKSFASEYFTDGMVPLLGCSTLDSVDVLSYHNEQSAPAAAHSLPPLSHADATQ